MKKSTTILATTLMLTGSFFAPDTINSSAVQAAETTPPTTSIIHTAEITPYVIAPLPGDHWNWTKTHTKKYTADTQREITNITNTAFLIGGAFYGIQATAARKASAKVYSGLSGLVYLKKQVNLYM